MSALASPYAVTLGIHSAEGPDVGLCFVLPFREILLGRTGFLHGGAIGGFLAVVSDEALERTLGTAGGATRCITSQIQFLRGGREMDTFASATVQRGSKILTVNALAWQEDRAKPIASVCRKYVVL